MRQDDDYDLPYRWASLLAEGGVKFAFSYEFNASGTRNLAYQAGQSVAFGLDRETALRSLTLTTAEILGVDKDLGSLEVGKKATLIVSEGDVMDPLVCRITFEFIEGKRVDLSNRHSDLYEKYRQRK